MRQKGSKLSLEHREKIRLARLGTHRSDITKEKIRIAKLGNKFHLGHKHTNETKSTIRDETPDNNIGALAELEDCDNATP